jgi:uncharacterized surface protein with fasciclin (FAS1) repeats
MEFEYPKNELPPPTYDIFKKDATGNPIWLETVEGLDQAKARVRLLRASGTGEYLVFSPAINSFLNLDAKTQSA